MLVTSILRPFGLPEAAVAVPAAAVAVLAGLVSPAAALAEVTELGPTVGFLAAILLLGHLVDGEGVFTWLGTRLASASAGRPRRLLALVFAAAAAVTAVLSLDATVVLLTPVVLATAARPAAARAPARLRLRTPGELVLVAAARLEPDRTSSRSPRHGLTFLGFTALMALPWAVSLAVEYGCCAGGSGLICARAPRHRPPTARRPPRFALAVLALTLVGFGVSSPLGVEPVVGGDGRGAGAGRTAPRTTEADDHAVGVVRAAAPLFCVFVLGLGVVVAAVGAQGLTAALRAVVRARRRCPACSPMAGIAAVLANVVNNLPARSLLAAGLGPAPGRSCRGCRVNMLAELLGVNIGPNADVRRAGRARAPAAAGEFTVLGMPTGRPRWARSPRCGCSTVPLAARPAARRSRCGWRS